MIKEVIAVVILLLLLAGSIVNVLYFEGLVNELLGHIDKAMEYAVKSEYESAVEELEYAIEKWSRGDRYTHIFIRHSEIGVVSEAFYDYLSDLCDENNKSAKGSYEKLRWSLTSILTMEHVTMGSVF
ncbi:MAG TPA: DUF4363 family protein [Clostridiales bacterium]|jgi:hypothetical protein|nr:DUF4363 family protein [Clostridiales bacterium]